MVRERLSGGLCATLRTGVIVLGLALLAQQAGAEPQRVFWAGYYSGIWSANTDGSDVQHVIDTSHDTAYEGWHARGLFWDPVGGHVYFTIDSDSYGRIQRMNCDGTGIEDVLLWRANDIVLDSERRIYWTQNAIIRAQLAGTDRQIIYLSGTNEFCGLAIDSAGGQIYWTEFSSNRILRSNLNGSALQVLVTGLRNPRHIDLDLVNGHMYWTEYDLPRICRANLDGSEMEVLLTSNYRLGGISLDVPAGMMYWRDSQGLLAADLDCNNIERLSQMGGDTYPGDVLVIPEPATVGLVVVGLSALLARRGKRRR